MLRFGLIFGVASGTFWFVLLTGFSGFSSSREAMALLSSGVLSGILISISIRSPLRKSGRLGTFVIGLMSLPIWAFLFGFFLTLIEMAIGVVTGGAYDLHPILTGLYYILLSVFSFASIYLIPLAVLTTFVLRAGAIHQARFENAALIKSQANDQSY